MQEGIEQVSSAIYLEAAYGRRYTTAEAAICAWKEGKDFKIRNGPYCSIRDLGLLNLEFPSGIYIAYENGYVKI